MQPVSSDRGLRICLEGLAVALEGVGRLVYPSAKAAARPLRQPLRAAAFRRAGSSEHGNTEAGELSFPGYRIRHPFTGPPLKNRSGVITPSRLNTMPSFRTNTT